MFDAYGLAAIKQQTKANREQAGKGNALARCPMCSGQLAATGTDKATHRCDQCDLEFEIIAVDP